MSQLAPPTEKLKGDLVALQSEAEQSLSYVSPGTYLFRYMDPRSNYFWPSLDDMLAGNQLVLNSRTNFNDPYDSQPVIENDLSNTELRAYLGDVLENPLSRPRSFERTAQIMHMKATGAHFAKKKIEVMKQNLHERTVRYLDTTGILSFSLTGEHPLLWGHYANSFGGVCAIFRRDASVNSVLSICANVTYVKSPPRLPLSLYCDLSRREVRKMPCEAVANKIFFLSYLHKSDQWRYEQEARIFFPFYAFKKMHFQPQELIGFIVGPKAPRELETRMRDEIKKHRPSLSLERALLSRNEYKIIIPHKFSSHHSKAA